MCVSMMRLARRLGQFRLEDFPAQVALEHAGVTEAFDNEKIGAVGHVDQRVGPGGVAGIGEQFLAVGNPQRRRRRARLVQRLRSVVTACPRISAGRPGSISTISNGKRHLLVSAPGKNTSIAASMRAREAGRPGDGERTFAPRHELRVEQQERQRAEMVAVQVRQDDAVDLAVVEPARLERHHRGRAAIDQQGRLRGLEPEAGVEAAAGTEGVAGADDGETHAQAPALGRADTAACQRRTCAHASGTASFAGFMKSMAIMPVMSATL